MRGVWLYGENLKMGKDVRGIERGKCACAECEDFMRSDGATCGYCGYLPTRHSKKDAPVLLWLCWWHIGCGNKWKRKSREVERWRHRAVPEVVGSSPSSLSEESSPESDFIPEPRSETSKYGRKGRDYYVSWEKIVFWCINFSTPVNNLH